MSNLSQRYCSTSGCIYLANPQEPTCEICKQIALSLNSIDEAEAARQLKGYRVSQKRASAKGYSKTITGRFSRARASAKRRNIDWKLSFEDFTTLSSNSCKYCYFPVEVATGSGLDRIDSSKTYVIDNVVACCSACNTAKNDNFSFIETLALGNVVRLIKTIRQARGEPAEIRSVFRVCVEQLIERCSYMSKIEQARAIIENFNSNPNGVKVDFDAFNLKLRDMGGVTDDLLTRVTWEDLMDCGLPKFLARQVAEAFRKTDSPVKTSNYVSDKAAATMTFAELLKRYDPVEFDNPIGKRLAAISKGAPCIVFDASGNVLVEVSAKEVKHLRDGFEARESVNVDGIPTRLYRVGERPGSFLEENPLYAGRPLRDGECDQTNRSWDGVSETVRQLLWLAVNDTRDVVIDQLKDAHDMIDLAVRSDAEKALRSRFKKTSLRFDELKAENKLPTLKIARGNGPVRKNNPFGVNRTY